MLMARDFQNNFGHIANQQLLVIPTRDNFDSTRLSCRSRSLYSVTSNLTGLFISKGPSIYRAAERTGQQRTHSQGHPLKTLQVCTKTVNSVPSIVI